MTVREIIALLVEQRDMGQEIDVYDEDRDVNLRVSRVELRADGRFPTIILKAEA